MIGVFDSGYGGLSVLNQLHRDLSEYSFVYFADSFHAPYGNKSKFEIYKWSKTNIEFLFNIGCNLVLVACNTVSATVLRELQDKHFNKSHPDKKLLGIIIPNVEYLVENLGCDLSLGIIGTKSTIYSQKYENEIFKKRSDLSIKSRAAKNLVDFIEQEKINTKEFEKNINKEIDFFNKLNIDCLLLACTHYSFIKKEIRRNLDKKIKILDSSSVVSLKTKKYLQKHKYLKIEKKKNNIYYSTGDIDKFKKNTKKLILDKKRLNNAVFLKSPIFSDN